MTLLRLSGWALLAALLSGSLGCSNNRQAVELQTRRRTIRKEISLWQFRLDDLDQRLGRSHFRTELSTRERQNISHKVTELRTQLAELQ